MGKIFRGMGGLNVGETNDGENIRVMGLGKSVGRGSDGGGGGGGGGGGEGGGDGGGGGVGAHAPQHTREGQ